MRWKLWKVEAPPHELTAVEMETPLLPTAIETRLGLDCLPNALRAPLKVETSGAALPSPCQLGCSRPVTSRWPKFQGRRVHLASTAPVLSRHLHPSASIVLSLLIAYHDKCHLNCQRQFQLSRQLPYPIPPNHPRAAPLHHVPFPHDYIPPITPAARWTVSRRPQPDMTRGGYGQHHVGLGF